LNKPEASKPGPEAWGGSSPCRLQPEAAPRRACVPPPSHQALRGSPQLPQNKLKIRYRALTAKVSLPLPLT